jgi:hypothetical protein
MILIRLLAEIRLKVKEGTHMTSVKIKESEIFTVSICVTKAIWPLDNFTCEETTEVIVVKYLIELTIWSVTPVSMIQGCL